MKRKGWSILLIVFAGVAFVMQFIAKFWSNNLLKSILFGLAVVCLYSLSDKIVTKKYYRILFIILAFMLVMSTAMTFWGLKVKAAPMWQLNGGLGASIYRFLTSGNWYNYFIYGVSALQWVLYVLIIIMERSRMNWMFLGKAVSMVIGVIWSALMPYLVHAFATSPYFLNIQHMIGLAFNSLWMVSAVMVGIRELRRKVIE